MRTTILMTAAILMCLQLNAQTLMKMELVNGIQVMPCHVNGLTLKFIIDTGEKDARISVTDAMFMLKNGYIDIEEITGTDYERFINGHIGTGTTLKIKKIVIGNTTLNNIIASVDPDLRTPLVIGQSVLYKIGKIEFDYSTQMVTIKSKNDYMINTASSTYNPGNPAASGMPNAPVSTTSLINEREKEQKVLVKVRTSLYSKPENGYSIVQVNSNSFVNLIGDVAENQNFVYVDYMGRKGYINRLALETK